MSDNRIIKNLWAGQKIIIPSPCKYIPGEGKIKVKKLCKSTYADKYSIKPPSRNYFPYEDK